MRAILTSVVTQYTYVYIYICAHISRDAIEPLYVNYSATCAAIIRGQKQTDDVTPGSIDGGEKAFGRRRRRVPIISQSLFNYDRPSLFSKRIGRIFAFSTRGSSWPSIKFVSREQRRRIAHTHVVTYLLTNLLADVQLSATRNSGDILIGSQRGFRDTEIR